MNCACLERYSSKAREVATMSCGEKELEEIGTGKRGKRWAGGRKEVGGKEKILTPVAKWQIPAWKR